MRFVRVALHRVAGLRKARPSDPAADRRSPLRSKRSARNVEAETFVHWKTVSSPSSYPVVRRAGRFDGEGGDVPADDAGASAPP